MTENIVITIGAKDAKGDHPVELRHGGKGLDDIGARINRQALLEDGHNFRPHDHGRAVPP